MKSYIYILSFLFLSVATHAQQEIGLHFMNSVAQSNYTNPSAINKYRINVTLPSLQMGYYNSVFAINDIIELEGSTMHIDLTNAMANMEATGNAISTYFGAEPIGVSVRFSKLQLGAHYGLRTRQQLTYPRGMFQFFWFGNGGVEEEVLDIGPSIDFSVYHEIGLSGAFKVNNQLSVGARLRYLSGLASIHTENSTIQLITDLDNYTLTAMTDYSLLSAGVDFDSDNGFELDYNQLFGSNTGMGLDLGATYIMLDNKLQLQASVLDIGSITWKDNLQETSTKATYNIEAFDLEPLLNGSDGSSNAVIDTLEQIFNFQSGSRSESFKTNLGAKYYLSATFTPIDGLHLGALFYNEQFQNTNHPSFALSVNKELGKIFALGAVYSARKNAYANIGMNMSLRMGPIQVYAVSDNVFSMFNALGGQNVNLRFGMNVAIAGDKKE